MSSRISIRLKAAFLLTVFALNTAVGFACAIGLDMGFNTTHHDDKKARVPVVHIHKDGKKHIHNQKKSSDDQDKSHKPDLSSTPEKSKSDTEGCCKEKVRNFEQLDKSVPGFLSIAHPIFFTAFVALYYDLKILPSSDIVKDIKPFVRSYHPPIPDIRIAIQSFQI